MLARPRPPFLRRTNRYGTTDSVCSTCLVIVAAARQEGDLNQAEQRHACNPVMLDDWSKLLNEIQLAALGRRRRL
ncbi:MAG TPA: hypothetical protein VGS10_09060 [Terracidiphilus sp.]|nr:hypothetical protein [Terracidiphilus sp.]